jgi:hypothetical protein
MPGATAIGVFLSASGLISQALGEERRALKRGIQSMCRKPGLAKAPQIPILALREASVRRMRGLIARADRKDNEWHVTSG